MLGGNIYLNFFLTSLVEIPGNAFAIYAMNRLVKFQTMCFKCFSFFTQDLSVDVGSVQCQSQEMVKNCTAKNKHCNKDSKSEENMPNMEPTISWSCSASLSSTSVQVHSTSAPARARVDVVFGLGKLKKNSWIFSQQFMSRVLVQEHDQIMQAA